MRYRRYEILLPLAYNEGSPIEPERYEQTLDELINQFGTVTLDYTIAIGHWMYRSNLSINY